MKTADLEPLLLEIRDLLKEQAHTLKKITDNQAAPSAPAHHGKHYWYYLIGFACVVLILGSAGAYQYYRILRSIIDQFPH